MTISTIGHQLQVNAVPAVVDVPTRINIKKRRERVVYRTLSNQDNVNLAYLIGQEVTPSNNMVISDRSTSLTQNRIPKTQDVTIETTSSFTLNVDKLLATDVFTVETATLPETPVFYQHTLENFNDGLLDFTSRTLLSIEFADEGLRPIEFSEYVFDAATGIIYNNIENSFSDVDSSFDVTFVKYTVRTVVGSVQTVEIFHELINNTPIYGLADFDDIDAFGNIKTGRKKYIVEEQLGGQLFLITMPVSARYAYKETPESRLRILPPTAIDISAPWNVRVSNGQFITSLQKTATSFVNHKYHIAEFNAQTFSPFPPFKFQPEQKATWITSSIIHVPKNIVSDSGLGLYIDVKIKDRANVLKYIYSTDPNKIGVIFEGTIRYTDGILSLDALNGFLELNDPVRDDDIITVTYFTEEDQYEFTPIDFNPVNNLNILRQRVVLYVNPETASTGDLDRSLYYLLVNSLGEITFSSQVAENFGALDPATQKMVNEDFNVDGTPNHTLYYDVESTTSGLNSRASGVNLAYLDEFSFIDKYTVESVLLNTTIEPSGVELLNFADNPRLLVLGDIYVGESQSPDDLTVLDVREQGGGIKEEFRTTAMTAQPEVMWYWDFNSKRPYPSASAFMAEIPQTLLVDHGGNFTRDQIESVVERHMEAGGYAILNTYGIDPVITDATVESGLFRVSWPSYGSQVDYNLYYSTSRTQGFILANDDELQDVPSGNNFTVSGLTPSTKCFVKIGALDLDDDESFGPTVALTTAAYIA